MPFVCTLFVGLFLIPDSAHAWGPITHLAHGSEILRELTTLGMALQQLLARHPYAYLYGCVGADITLAKKFTRRMQVHCHSWQVGWQMLAGAAADSERAFAYGYLTHLAADVFSHNHFVPTQLIVSYRARALRHIYWEARLDSMQDPQYRTVLRQLRRRDFPECDALVKRVVARTIFPFRTNKQIFDSVLAFHDWDNWHRILQQIVTRSRYALPPGLVPRYNALCLASVRDVLVRGPHAACQSADPTGLAALTLAKDVRRKLKLLQRRAAITPRIEADIERLNRRADLDGDRAAAADIVRALG